MVVNLNFNLEAWIKQLSIEALSEEDAIQQLMSMSLAELVEAGAIIADKKITDVTSTISEYSLIVQVSNIKWNLDPEIMDINVIEYLKNFLPGELKVTLEDVTDTDDIKELISEALFLETNYDAESFDFEIIETK